MGAKAQEELALVWSVGSQGDQQGCNYSMQHPDLTCSVQMNQCTEFSCKNSGQERFIRKGSSVWTLLLLSPVGFWPSLQKVGSLFWGKIWLEFIAVDGYTASGFNWSILTLHLSTGYRYLLLVERQRMIQISQVMTPLFITFSSCLKGQQPEVSMR